ncbi:HPP family protein [Vibrio rumoiensis]|uniref:Phage tail protein n=1 Tax=Vibrio rumoiensis 1S-45 TaxID=1188252 RepID=A0A1E5E3G1_9VIBR|nr:CBS domain-containing protein [Vibrio rumoiensis]OEF26824.1 phage tail protein [Vibrio rumoiensis 1S-45]
MERLINQGRKWSLRLLAQLGVVKKDSQSISAIPLSERMKVSLAAFITIFTVTIVSGYVQDPGAALVLLGSMGASSVIIFALPSSPLAKPWSFMVGHMLAAVVGITMALIIDDFALLAGVTIAIILMLMYIFECMHPPAAATALVPAIGSRSLDVGYEFLIPIMINLFVFLIVSLMLKQSILRRKKIVTTENFDPVHLHNDQSPLKRLGLQQDDLMQAINSFDSVLAVSEQDLEQIYQEAQRHAYQRRSGEILSRDIMSSDVITVRANTSLGRAWKLLHKHKISMLPVVNDEKELLGVISSVDFLKNLSVPSYSGLLKHLNRMLVKRKHTKEVNNRVQDLMVTDVVAVKDTDHIVALVPLLSDIGLHHIPVLDSEQKLCGIITQSDLIGALYQVNQKG